MAARPCTVWTPFGPKVMQMQWVRRASAKVSGSGEIFGAEYEMQPPRLHVYSIIGAFGIKRVRAVHFG